MLGQGWEWQWNRVRRRLDEVQAVYTGAPGGTDHAIDVVLSFFEAAYHLKDWLKNDPKSGVTEADVEAWINGLLILQLCGDLANGSKHLKLTSSRTGDLSTTMARSSVDVLVGTGTSAHRFDIVSGDKEYDALTVAKCAVGKWSEFLSKRGLI